MQHLEANCLAGSREAVDLLETRLANLEKRASSEKEDLRGAFADGPRVVFGQQSLINLNLGWTNR